MSFQEKGVQIAQSEIEKTTEEARQDIADYMLYRFTHIHKDIRLSTFKAYMVELGLDSYINWDAIRE